MEKFTCKFRITQREGLEIEYKFMFYALHMIGTAWPLEYSQLET